MIVFNQVSKRFFNDTFGVKDLSFAVDSGELVMISGPSGSGKTTLMRLLIKEYQPTEGEIYFNKQPLSEVSSGKVHLHRRQVGVVFQDYRLMPEMNVWENIALPLSITGKTEAEMQERVTDLLRLVELENKAELFPNEISGGEAQRVSIARALASGPNVLFADEPTGNLDADSSIAIIRLLEKINELGTTILIATHDVVVLDALKKHRHLVLKEGQLAKDSHPRPVSTPVENESVSEPKVEKASEKTTEVVKAETDAPEEKPLKHGPRLRLSLPKLFGKKKVAATEPEPKKGIAEVKDLDTASAEKAETTEKEKEETTDKPEKSEKPEKTHPSKLSKNIKEFEPESL